MAYRSGRCGSLGTKGGGCAKPERWGMKRVMLRVLRSLPYIALCTAVLALGLVAGYLLAAPLSPQVPFYPNGSLTSTIDACIPSGFLASEYKHNKCLYNSDS